MGKCSLVKSRVSGPLLRSRILWLKIMNTNSFTQEFKKDSHCSYCGSKFTEQVLWPRKCFRCYNDSFSNPIPVVCAVLNVWARENWDLRTGPEKIGCLIQQRNIEPKKGEWALTGGYMNAGETWEEALVREVQEELNIKTDPRRFRLEDIKSNTSKSNILIFATYLNVIWEDDLLKFIPNEEVSAIKVVHEPIELAFPTHTEMLQKHFSK